MSIFRWTSGTTKVVLTLAALSVVFIAAMLFHYHRQNEAVDKRTRPARMAMKAFDEAMKDGNYPLALGKLDEAHAVFSELPVYRDSYEMGVMENNRAALAMVEFQLKINNRDAFNPDEADRALLAAAREHSLKAEAIYRDWMKRTQGMSESDVRQWLAPAFEPDFYGASPDEARRALDRRVKEVMEAKAEMPRRLSVTLTNLGILARWSGEPEASAKHYADALALWPENQAAKENLAKLQGRQPEKPGILESLFPPDRKAASGN